MMENILEIAKSVVNLEVISHSIVILGAIGVVGKWMLAYRKRRNQKKDLRQLILKWHEELLNTQKLEQTPSGYTTKANTARVEITKDLFDDLEFAKQEKISCLTDQEKEEFRQALYDILRRNKSLQHWAADLRDFPIETYFEIFKKFQTSLPWLKL